MPAQTAYVVRFHPRPVCHLKGRPTPPRSGAFHKCPGAGTVNLFLKRCTRSLVARRNAFHPTRHDGVAVYARRATGGMRQRSVRPHTRESGLSTYCVSLAPAGSATDSQPFTMLQFSRVRPPPVSLPALHDSAKVPVSDVDEARPNAKPFGAPAGRKWKVRRSSFNGRHCRLVENGMPG